MQKKLPLNEQIQKIRKIILLTEEMSSDDKEAWKKGMDKDYAEVEQELGNDSGEHGDMTTDCRSEIGITIGLVDSLISICRILKPRLKDDDDILGALADLRDDEDLAAILSYGKTDDV